MSSSEHEPLPYHTFLYHVQKALGEYSDTVMATKFTTTPEAEKYFELCGIQSGFLVTPIEPHRSSLLVGLTNFDVADPTTELVIVGQIQVLELPHEPALVKLVANKLVSLYTMRWLTELRDINTRFFAKEWPNNKYFIGLKDISPTREHTAETISAKLKGFLELYRQEGQ